MILQIVAVFDLKAHSFSNPFFMAHEDLAVRAFVEASRQQGNSINRYPEDHVLYHLGQFDDATGEFSLFPQQKILIAGSSIPRQADVYTAPSQEKANAAS